MKYSEKLKDPRWQKRRLEIFERDGWVCKACKVECKTLCVHHKWYERGDPWEASDESLVTLCEDCHQIETEWRKPTEDELIQTLKQFIPVGGLVALKDIVEKKELRGKLFNLVEELIAEEG